MTREEAINYLKSFELCKPYTMDSQGVYKMARDVAIKALEQPNIAQWVSKGDIYPAWKYCSKCKEPWTFDCGTPNYCPNCGAKMESAEE